jgi:DNA-binding CsgD family transcriptional regulator
MLKTNLSARELSVLTFAAQGFTDEMIAHELGIQSGTVNSYWVRIRGKRGNLSRSELVARFVQTNADVAHSDYVTTNDEEAAILAEENRLILGKANAEIEHLKQLLSKSKES